MAASRWFLKGRMPRAGHQLSNQLDPRVLILCRASKRMGRAVQLPRFRVKGEKNRVVRRGSSQPSGDVQNAVKRNRSFLVLRRLGLCVFTRKTNLVLSSPSISLPGCVRITPARWRKRSLPDDDQATANLVSDVCDSRGQRQKPPWSFQRSARGRDETPRSSEGDAAHAPISSSLVSYSRRSAPSVVAEGRDQTSERMARWFWTLARTGFIHTARRPSVQYSKSHRELSAVALSARGPDGTFHTCRLGA